MTEFIVLSRPDILALCDDKPVTVYIDKKPYVLCTDECFEKQRKADTWSIKDVSDALAKHGLMVEQEQKEREDPVVDDDKLALLEKTYADFCNSEGSEGWLRIDGIDYYTDVGYALEGMKIFMEVYKRRLAEREEQNGSKDEG